MIEVFQDNDDVYRFRVKSPSGSILLNSIEFPKKEKLQNTVSAINRSKGNHLLFERHTNHNGKFLFKLRLKDGIIIGQSLPYNSEPGMENGIKNLKNIMAAL